MPIYAYKCASCGHAKDVLQKISDDPLTVCPACGAGTFSKQLTAAGFQLKGSGWYVTDFKGGSAPAPSSAPAAPDAKPADAKPSDAKPAESTAAAKPDAGTPAPKKTETPSASAGGCGACA
jgi:putative FmdB family regulatory protein